MAVCISKRIFDRDLNFIDGFIVRIVRYRLTIMFYSFKVTEMNTNQVDRVKNLHESLIHRRVTRLRTMN